MVFATTPVLASALIFARRPGKASTDAVAPALASSGQVPTIAATATVAIIIFIPVSAVMAHWTGDALPSVPRLGLAIDDVVAPVVRPGDDFHCTEMPRSLSPPISIY